MMLGAVGLAPDEERLYRLMLDDPHADVAELCAQSGWPEARVRKGLDGLARLSLLRPSGDKPGELTLVSPQIGLVSLLDRREADLAARQKEILESRVAVAEMLSRYLDTHPPVDHPDAEQLVGIDQIRARIEELVASCECEVMSFSPGGPQTAENMAQSKPLDGVLLGRGVQMRTIYLDSVRNDPRSVEYATWLAENGGQVRTVPALPLRMIIMDRKVAVAAVNPEHSDVGALVLHSPGLVLGFCELFQTTWAKASPFGAAPSRNRHGLTPQERAILELLAQGLTDEVVARRMGVSVRTGRRITAELMVRLGVRSRFQAGIRIAQLGWLDSSATPDGGGAPAEGAPENAG
jgi:DNA-binding CsgD family transcriptional regulator/sugar-specific transcriptional regulator TrmB